MNASETGLLPETWVPQTARDYLDHVEDGRSLRSLARERGCHASTVLRRVRRIEGRRDDPLIDLVLSRIGQGCSIGGETGMSDTTTKTTPSAKAAELEREARRILRRLAEPHTCLVAAPQMETAVVMRETAQGESVRVAVLSRQVAEAMALRDWIEPRRRGRVLRYGLTATGRAALRRMQAADAGTDAPFAAQHRDMQDRETDRGGRARYNAAESPLSVLARRRGRDGKPFLSADLVTAGERLREDFELAQMGPRVAQNWDRFLTAGVDGGGAADRAGTGPDSARARVHAALRDLGPGLGDVVLRACCFLEGMESIERRMGWAARSGKIVLRIGLQRLLRHYDERHGGRAPLIG